MTNGPGAEIPHPQEQNQPNNQPTPKMNRAQPLRNIQKWVESLFARNRSQDVVPNNPQQRERENRSAFLTFMKDGQEFSIQRSRFVDNAGKPIDTTDRERNVRLDITTTEGYPRGEILGAFITDDQGQEEEFFNSSFRNLSGPRGLVREALAQMLIQKKVNKSSCVVTLTDEGKHAYEVLMQDPRLIGTKEELPERDSDTGELRYKYTLQAREEISG